MESTIITLPIKAYEKDKIGLLVIPIFAETLKAKTKFEAALALNLVDSFEDRISYIEKYYQLIKNTNIDLDAVWIDSKNKQQLLDELTKLVKLGYIKEKDKHIKSCKCCKVEIDEELLEKVNGKCYRKENGDFFCNFCNEPIKVNTERCLVFEVPVNTSEKIVTIPRRISKQIQELDKRIGGNDIIISRKRKTGYQYLYNNNLYNIDVDFMWQNYLATIPKENTKVIIASNHAIYSMYMINLIEKCKGKENHIFVALPYVKELENIDFMNKDSKISKMVLSMVASKMKNEDSKWDNEMYKYIEKLPDKQKEKYFEELYSKIDVNKDESIENYINRIVLEKMNFQKITKKIRGEREAER